MTKSVSTGKKSCKQYTPEFRHEALKLAARTGMAVAARELSLYESQHYARRSKQQNQHFSFEYGQEMSTEDARKTYRSRTISGES